MPETMARHERGVQLADGDVVEEEEGLGTAHENVVRAHRHEVDADRVVAVHELRDLELGADAVGARDEHRVFHLLDAPRR